jgi:serine/threonine-protein kinase Stk1
VAASDLKLTPPVRARPTAVSEPTEAAGGRGPSELPTQTPPKAAATQHQSQAPTAKAPRFVLKELLGRGPLGVIHRGEDTADGNKPVAMRLLPASAAPHLQASMADLKAVAALSHPNVVRVLGAIDVQGQRAVVTELVQGATLASPLKAGQKLGLPQVQGIARALVQALAFVHGKGFAHGSIQPSNVMSAAGHIKLADLGLGRLHLALVPPSPYRAPEAKLDAPGDVFALAALLHHLLTGQLPQPGAAQALPAPFDQMVPRCLDLKPEARPKSPELAALLGIKA